MKTPIFTFIIFCFFYNCSGPSEHEYEQALRELEECRLVVEDIENTPERRLNKSIGYMEKGDDRLAISSLKELIEKYPNSEQSKKAQDMIGQIEAAQLAAKNEADRIKELGYKVLEASHSVSLELLNIKIDFSSVQKSKKWVFDRYGDRYFYNEADRDKINVVLTAKVTSTINDPVLPSIDVYALIDGELAYQNSMMWKFYRWEDYGCYLGNYADYGNDFAKSPSIRFSPGATIADSIASKSKLYLLVGKSGCYIRSSSKYDNPPVFYQRSCPRSEKYISVEQAKNDYHLIKVL